MMKRTFGANLSIQSVHLSMVVKASRALSDMVIWPADGNASDSMTMTLRSVKNALMAAQSSCVRWGRESIESMIASSYVVIRSGIFNPPESLSSFQNSSVKIRPELVYSLAVDIHIVNHRIHWMIYFLPSA